MSSNYWMAIIQDLDIISKVLGGNIDAFEFLVLKYQDKTYGFCFKLLKDADKAAEAAHLSFIKAFENLKNFRKDSNFSTWLYRIAYNICLDQFRYEKRFIRETEPDAQTDWSNDEINAGIDYLSAAERKKYLGMALQKISIEEKALIFNFYEEEMSIKELAEITGLSPSNVKVKLYRVRKKLYIELEKVLKDEVASLLR